MAHFAQLDGDTVTRVVVVANAEAPDEATGIAFCRSLFGPDTEWRQCSYNGNIRKQFPGPGFVYDEAGDVFVAPRPFPSWTLAANHDWQAPVAKPGAGGPWIWNETAQAWDAAP